MALFFKILSINQYHGGKQQVYQIATPRTTFKGEFPELEGTYFDLSTVYRAYMYKKSICLMIGYAAKNMTTVTI